MRSSALLSSDDGNDPSTASLPIDGTASSVPGSTRTGATADPASFTGGAAGGGGGGAVSIATTGGGLASGGGAAGGGGASTTAGAAGRLAGAATARFGGDFAATLLGVSTGTFTVTVS